MPAVQLPLNTMTVSEKMEVLESVWNSLRDNDAKLSSPGWHKKVLAERAALLKAGKARLSPWAEAKERIRKRVRGNPHT
jgi:putative addiction module component (TIGR02574 family)